jgi:hypothetical protein
MTSNAVQKPMTILLYGVTLIVGKRFSSRPHHDAMTTIAARDRPYEDERAIVVGVNSGHDIPKSKRLAEFVECACGECDPNSAPASAVTAA